MIKKYSIFIVILLLAITFIVQIYSANHDCQTVDEGVYISTGYTYFTNRESKLNIEHPPLAKLIAASPLLFIQPKITDAAKEFIKKNDQYYFAHEFLYNSNNNADKIIFWARFSFILITILLGIVLYFFTKKLFRSELAGIIALFFYSLNPDIIAHGHLATNDLLLTLFFFLTAICTYNYFAKPNLKYLLFLILSLSAAIATKFSGLILVPILILIFVVQGLLNKELIKKYWLDFAKIAISCLLLITAFYCAVGLSFHDLFSGIIIQLSRGGTPAYLFGHISQTGWWYYLPVAFIIKTPIAILVILAILIIKSRISNYKKYYILVLFPVVLFLASLLGHIDIGLRYLLPIYPFIFLAMSSIATNLLLKKLYFKIIFALLCLWYLVSFTTITPHQLTYFNEFVGGPKNGAKFLVDSNIDWGQDLKRLKTYLTKNNISTPIYLSYFGTADPSYYQINSQKITDYTGPIHGIVAVSVTNLKLLEKNNLNWLVAYTPIDKIGNSIYIYNIPTTTQWGQMYEEIK